MRINSKLFDVLTKQAKASNRLRFAYDLRTSPNDNSQRMLNALEPGTIMPIHRHRSSSESMVIIRGRLVERFYDDNGNLVDEFEMAPCGTCPMVQIEAGHWHSLEVLESGTIIFEAKDGPYSPLDPEDIMQ